MWQTWILISDLGVKVNEIKIPNRVLPWKSWEKWKDHNKYLTYPLYNSDRVMLLICRTKITTYRRIEWLLRERSESFVRK